MLAPSAEAFALACFPVALLHEEERLHVEGNLCPMLKSNLRAALRLQKHWFGSRGPVPEITSLSTVPGPGLRDGMPAGCFVSGGVDSLANIVRNAEFFPVGHPCRFRFAFPVHGMDLGLPHHQDSGQGLFARAVDRLQAAVATFELEVTPVWTDLRYLEPQWQLYSYRQTSPLLAGLAHGLGGGIGRCAIALDFAAETYTVPWGSHPRLNRLLGSSFVTFTSELEDVARTEKVGLLSRNPSVLGALRVCQRELRGEEALNCGRCEKCIRTKAALFVYGALERCPTFLDGTLSAELIRWIETPEHWMVAEFWGDLIPKLEALGEREWADARPGWQFAEPIRCG